MYYTGTANAYEWNPKNRGGGEMDNVGAASIVAVNTDRRQSRMALCRRSGRSLGLRHSADADGDHASTARRPIVQPNKTGYIHYLDAKTGKFIKATPFADKIDWIKGYDKQWPADRPGRAAQGRRRPGDDLAEPAGRREHVPERLQPEDRQSVSCRYQLRHEVRVRGDQGHQQRASLRRLSGVHLRQRSRQGASTRRPARKCGATRTASPATRAAC